MDSDDANPFLSCIGEKFYEIKKSFKAKIYNHLDDDGKKEFIEAWKALDENATAANESIQSLFYWIL